jgi:DUF1680 family protein
MVSKPKGNNMLKNVFSLKFIAMLMIALISSGVILAEDKYLYPVKVTDIKLSGEIGRRIDLTVQKNILAMNDEGVIKDKFLKPFIKVEGKRICSNEIWGDYVGLGKTMEAITRLAAYTHNECLMKMKNDYFDILYAQQDEDGFIGWADGKERNEKLWVIHEACYLIQCFITNYEYFNDERSLQAAQKLADWILDNITQSKMGIYQIGLPSVLTRLYEVTQDQRYIHGLRDILKLYSNSSPAKNSTLPVPMGDTGTCAPVAIKKNDNGIDNPGAHVYSDLEPSCAQVKLLMLLPEGTMDSTRWKTSLNALLVRGGMLLPGTCTGTGEYGEYWNFQQKGEKYSETCATCYLIRFMHLMIQYNGDSLYGDVMERAVYNGLFAAQDPNGRKLCYHTPFTGPREYFSMDTYCCPGNFRRLMGELPELIYYRSNDGITVNLYEGSHVHFKHHTTDIDLVQTTDYPSDGKVKIELKPAQPIEFSLSLRIPRWCQKADITINDEKAQEVSGGKFHTVKRTWKMGDTVELQMPMPWRWVKGRMLQAGRVALMRGPVVFCFNPNNIKADEASNPNHIAFNGKDSKMLDYDYQRNIIIDAATIEGPVKDDSIRPNGRAAKIKAWSTLKPICFDPDIEITLKEFIDFSGQATYFVPKDSAGLNIVDDELIGTCVLK